jgi:hypothetical protein
MTLFDQVLQYVKSAGHAIESEEHKLLDEFVTYLASNSVVAGFFQNSGTEQEHEVVANFASSLMPAEQFAQPDLAAIASPIEVAPVEPAPAPVVEEPVAPVVDAAPTEPVVASED